MSTSGAIGYFDKNGLYRATLVGADTYPESIIEDLSSMISKSTAKQFQKWVENGIAGGGYDGLYNQETMEERGESNGPVLIDASNYDSASLSYTYVVVDGKLSFFDPKNIKGYDPKELNS